MAIRACELKRSALANLSADDLPSTPLLVNLDLDIVDPIALSCPRYPAQNGQGVLRPPTPSSAPAGWARSQPRLYLGT